MKEFDILDLHRRGEVVKSDILRFMAKAKKDPNMMETVGVGDDDVFDLILNSLNLQVEQYAIGKRVNHKLGFVESWRKTNWGNVVLYHKKILTGEGFGARELWIAGKERMKELVKDFSR